MSAVLAGPSTSVCADQRSVAGSQLLQAEEHTYLWPGAPASRGPRGSLAPCPWSSACAAPWRSLALRHQHSQHYRFRRSTKAGGPLTRAAEHLEGPAYPGGFASLYGLPWSRDRGRLCRRRAAGLGRDIQADGLVPASPQPSREQPWRALLLLLQRIRRLCTQARTWLRARATHLLGVRQGAHGCHRYAC